MFNLCITLRKDTETPEQAQQIYEIVKQKLADHPEVIVTGHVSNHYDMPEEPEHD